jgi:peptide deformylase
MARRDILEYPDPRLRRACREVTDFDDSLASLARDLQDTLRAGTGMALSAPQVGARRRVLILDLHPDAGDAEVFVNPEIRARSAPGLVAESCLSLPGISGTVLRFTRLRVRAWDLQGRAFDRELQGMPAVCLQHELDHLDGRLFIDRLPFWRRFSIRRALGPEPAAMA